jgi:site-specific recombinase XerC
LAVVVSVAAIQRERHLVLVSVLGHSNISTTQRYMHLDDREFADAQDLVESASIHNTT